MHGRVDRGEDEPGTAASAPASNREPRRPRAAEKAINAEELVCGFVAKLQGQGNAEAERLREAMRKAIAVLQAVLG